MSGLYPFEIECSPEYALLTVQIPGDKMLKVEASAMASMDRHVQMKSSYEGTIADIEGIDQDQVAAEILQLQTNIEVSYRASSIVFNLTLSDYL